MVNMRFWYEMLSAFGFGVLSSVVPIFNSEAFIVAAQASRLLTPLSMAIGLGLGHGVGKQIIFLGVRHGKDLPFIKRQVGIEPPLGSRREKWRTWTLSLAHLVETPKWGHPILFMAAVTGVPPVFAVVLLAGATKMNFWLFSLNITVGLFLRCYILALLTAGVISITF